MFVETNLCYTILIYRCDLCIYGDSRRQRQTFDRPTSRSLAFNLSQYFFALKARLLYSLRVIKIVVSRSMEEVSAHWDEFLILPIYCCLRGDGIESRLTILHCLVKNPGGF